MKVFAGVVTGSSATLALLAEGTSWARALRQTLPRAERRHRGLVRFVRESSEPTTKAVLYEDSAAVVGVVIALVAVALHELTGDPVWDNVGSILVGVLLMGVAAGLFRDTKGLVIGEAAPPDEPARIRRAIESQDEVAEALDLRTMYMGPRVLVVAARIDLRDAVDSAKIEQMSDEIDRRLREQVPTVRQVFLDSTPGRPAAAPVR